MIIILTRKEAEQKIVKSQVAFTDELEALLKKYNIDSRMFVGSMKLEYDPSDCDREDAKKADEHEHAVVAAINLLGGDKRQLAILIGVLMEQSHDFVHLLKDAVFAADHMKNHGGIEIEVTQHSHHGKNCDHHHA